MKPHSQRQTKFLGILTHIHCIVPAFVHFPKSIYLGHTSQIKETKNNLIHGWNFILFLRKES